jgi:DNA replication protein DnaC
MLAIGLARAAVDAGHRVYFTTAADLAARCHKAAVEGRWATLLLGARPAPLARASQLGPDHGETPSVDR